MGQNGVREALLSRNGWESLDLPAFQAYGFAARTDGFRHMTTRYLAFALVTTVSCGTAQAADIVGAWDLHGSVFFNAVDTTCLFKPDGEGIAATCENDGKPGDYTPARITATKVSWSWDAGPALLTFDGAFASDTVIKGTISVRGFTGRFTATKQQ